MSDQIETYGRDSLPKGEPYDTAWRVICEVTAPQVLGHCERQNWGRAIANAIREERKAAKRPMDYALERGEAQATEVLAKEIDGLQQQFKALSVELETALRARDGLRKGWAETRRELEAAESTVETQRQALQATRKEAFEAGYNARPGVRGSWSFEPRAETDSTRTVAHAFAAFEAALQPGTREERFATDAPVMEQRAAPDDAPWPDVLRYVRWCAQHWPGEARLLGNVRACDIVRAVNEMFTEIQAKATSASTVETQGTRP